MARPNCHPWSCTIEDTIPIVSASKLNSSGLPGSIAETLTGHSAGKVHEQYVHKELISMKTLQEGLDKLKFDDVVKVPI